MLSNWREFKYQIADKLFRRELDDAYALGLRGGVQFATRKISFEVNLKSESVLMTKTQKLGYDRAAEIVKDTRKLVEQQVGMKH